MSTSCWRDMNLRNVVFCVSLEKSRIRKKTSKIGWLDVWGLSREDYAGEGEGGDLHWQTARLSAQPIVEKRVSADCCRACLETYFQTACAPLQTGAVFNAGVRLVCRFVCYQVVSKSFFNLFDSSLAESSQAMTSHRKLRGKDMSDFDELDVDDLLTQLSAEELEILSKEVDPDVRLLDST